MENQNIVKELEKGFKEVTQDDLDQAAKLSEEISKKVCEENAKADEVLPMCQRAFSIFFN